jgi:hypothetical protein
MNDNQTDYEAGKKEILERIRKLIHNLEIADSYGYGEPGFKRGCQSTVCEIIEAFPELSIPDAETTKPRGQE